MVEINKFDVFEQDERALFFFLASFGVSWLFCDAQAEEYIEVPAAHDRGVVLAACQHFLHGSELVSCQIVELTLLVGKTLSACDRNLVFRRLTHRVEHTADTEVGLLVDGFLVEQRITDRCQQKVTLGILHATAYENVVLMRVSWKVNIL